MKKSLSESQEFDTQSQSIGSQMSTISGTSDAEFQRELTMLEIAQKEDKLDVVRKSLESVNLPFPKISVLLDDNVSQS